MKLDFPILVEVARDLILEQKERNLYDSEIAALQCAWESIDYKEFEADSPKFTEKYSECYRHPGKTKKTKTLMSAASNIFTCFSEKYNLENLNRITLRRTMQDLVDQGELEIHEFIHEEKLFNQYDIEELSFSGDIEPVFVSREKEILEVKNILKSYTVLILYGSSGIGKTSLITVLSEKYIEDNNFFYTDLRYIKDFKQWSYNILTQANLTQSINEDNFCAKLSEIFSRSDALIVLDSIYKLDKEITAFIDSLIITNDIKAKIVLVSNMRIEPKIAPQHTFHFKLKGLSDKEDIIRYFRSLGLKFSEGSLEYLEEMNNFYEGNFIELQYVSRYINDFFSGDIKAYWQSGSRILSSQIEESFKSISFLPIDYEIFDIFKDENTCVISSNAFNSLRKNSRSRLFFARITELCSLGYLTQSKDSNHNRVYSISPLLKYYLEQEDSFGS